MISILIPTFDTDSIPLAEKLKRMADKSGVPYEIVIADDASFEGYRERNGYIATWPECRFLQMEQNVGFAAVRNYLADNAQYSYLLFIDGNAMPASPEFFEQYIDMAHPHSVVCGGLAESSRPEFTAANFMIYRETFQKLRFDVACRRGTEGALFADSLREAGVGITFIDNPVDM